MKLETRDEGLKTGRAWFATITSLQPLDPEPPQ